MLIPSHLSKQLEGRQLNALGKITNSENTKACEVGVNLDPLKIQKATVGWLSRNN